jgi:signal transduction histidine kinase
MTPERRLGIGYIREADDRPTVHVPGLFRARIHPHHPATEVERQRLTDHIGSPDLALKVVEYACDLVRAPFGSVVTIGVDGEIGDFATNGVPFERRSLREPGATAGVMQRVRSSRQPVRAQTDDDVCLVGLPRDHGIVQVLAVPMCICGELVGAVWVARKQSDNAFSDDDEDTLVAFADNAALALDNARLRAEARAWEPALSAVRDVSHALLEGQATDDVLLLVAGSARAVLGAELTTVAVQDRSGYILVRVADGAHAEEVQDRRVSVEGSAIGDVMRTRRPLTVASAGAVGDRFQQFAGVPDIGPIVLVPMVFADRVFGAFSAMRRSGSSPFSADDLLLVQAFAAEAAMALEHEQIRSELDRLALLEDRERIAMELHDGVVQALFVVGLSLQAAETVADDAGQIRLRLSQAIDSIDGAIRDLRNYIFGLRPADLADRHLERALRKVTENVERSGRVSTTLELDGRAALLLATRSDTIIQAAREAMTNAVKHSGGDRVSVRFAVAGDEVVLEVGDNGHGFDVDAHSMGHGIPNLRARAEDLGGVLEIESSPESGTTVRIRVPV